MSWHLPVADVETQPFWDAAREGRLLIKRCNGCSRAFFYPRAACPRCWSTDTSWIDASGRGTVYTFTVIHQNDVPPFKDRVPYTVAIIDLEEGVRMTANVEGDVACGMGVSVAFREESADEATLGIPFFRQA